MTVRSRITSRLTAGTSLVFAAAVLATGAGTAAAQESSTGIETVVVSAQFTETNLQATPLAITAITGAEISDRGLTNITELAQTMPNVRFTMGGSAFGNITQASIRGIGQGDFNFAFEPGVGMYIDDVYYATMFGTVFDLLDVERVEAVRGPSGTLFGKNSIGGAVRMLSRKPQGDNTGYLEITYGDFDRIDVRGTADVSIIEDRLAMRVTAVSKQREGYQEVVDFACRFPGLAGTLPSHASGKTCVVDHHGGEDARAARVAFRAVISPQAELNIAAHVMHDNSPIQADTLLAADLGPIAAPDGIFVNDFNGGFHQIPYSDVAGSGCVLCGFWNDRVNIPTYGIPWDTRFFAKDIYTTYATYESFDGVREPQRRTVNSWGTHANLDWDLSDNLHFKNIIAYQYYQGNISHDADGSPLSIQIANSTVSNWQWTEEARFTGTLFDRLDWTLGAFYLESRGTLHGPVLLDLFAADPAPYGDGCPGSPATCPPVPPLRFGQNDTIDIESWSAYIHGVFKVTDVWNVFGGYRYSHDKKSYLFDHSKPVAGVPASGFFAITTPAVSSDPRNDYRVGTDFHITPDHMIYAQISTGYRAGGINPRPFSPAQLTTFGPEQATAYEIGAKTDWWDHRLRANLSLFYTDYKDRIINQQILDNSGLPFTGPINLGTATVKGGELEITFAPIEKLLISFDYGWMDIELDPQAGAPAGFIDGCTGPPHCAAPVAGTIRKGSITPGIPETTMNASIQYTFGGGDWGSLTPRLDWTYWSRVYGDNINSRIASTDPQDLFNARITWDAPVGDWSVAFQVTNLADEEYFVNKFTLLPFALGTLEGQPAAPQQWAIIVRKTF